ncbi:prepilin-type N-terminal cleavage/methylation domain-containing protein [Puniceicoccus vermicola]|uniref:Prepilin-type N-terminal cleavage/methylation domain-containing protein n=1 Tax=Puniceicoccus vermicola TaxID=388746 RepID=A0A7X1AV39_9BACT|nr:prepilin-type N-terminal cleavage/methylation domain-containing protein [Puniceicoccus vermicola]MBC2600556.1 prepilin-type N-terminal cleavage/methylation domain-containing protein [Puniceicoccus vermicola]
MGVSIVTRLMLPLRRPSAGQITPLKKAKPLIGFTLIELLVCIAVLGILVALVFPAISKARSGADQTADAAKMRNIGQAVILFSQDHNGVFPRSWHSSGANREPGWAQSIAPYMGASSSEISGEWARTFNRYFRAPDDDNIDPYLYSYGFNVNFELDPNGDDYTGSPQTWRKVSQVPDPGHTILVARIQPIQFADHFMCHLWSSISAAENIVNYDVHKGQANYLFVDGHVETLALAETFNPSQKINRWNPSLSR